MKRILSFYTVWLALVGVALGDMPQIGSLPTVLHSGVIVGNGAGVTNTSFGPITNVVMAIQGDSWSDPTFLVPPWDTIIRTQFFAPLNLVYWTNVAVQGYTTADASNDYPKIHAIAAMLSATNVGLYILPVGINDKNQFDATGLFSSPTPQQSFSYASNCWFRARADGFKVVGSTVPPMGSAETITITVWRTTYNELVLANKQLYDGLIDLAAYFANPFNANIISNTDNLHPTQLGTKILTRAIAEEVSRVLRGVPERQPFADNGDLQYSMRNWSNATFSGNTVITNNVDGATSPGIWFGEHNYADCLIVNATCSDPGRETNLFRVDMQNNGTIGTDNNFVRFRFFNGANYASQVAGTWSMTEAGNFINPSNVNANTFSSAATNRAAISATGYTNTLAVNGTAVNADVYFTGSTVVLKDSGNTTMFTLSSGFTTNTHLVLKPNWAITGTSMTGTAFAQ